MFFYGLLYRQKITDAIYSSFKEGELKIRLRLWVVMGKTKMG